MPHGKERAALHGCGMREIAVDGLQVDGVVVVTEPSCTNLECQTMEPFSWKYAVRISHLRAGSLQRRILMAALLALSSGWGLNAQANSGAPTSAAVESPGQSQVQPVPARITSAIDGKQLLVLKGNTHPLAQAQFDRGVASSAEPMRRMLLVLQRSPEQESALRQFLDEQQTKTSGSFQKWLTPEQFGAQFGVAEADIQTVTQWLQSQGFSVDRVAASRMVIEFSGNAGQVQTAFHTAIHHYVVNGKDHVANADDPQIPAAIAPVVAGIVSLHNFGRKSHARVMGMVQRNMKTGKTTPLITLPYGTPAFYGVGPSDFAKIYNTQALWDAGVDGTGQSVAVVGETNINLADVKAFRNIFALPNNDPEIILNGEDPGITSIEEEAEADLDVQWSGGVAKNAKIKFVVSASTPASAGVDLSALYIIEHNLAGVMSESYGECEKNLLTAGNQFYKTLWQQAAAQGITVVISSGDGGSAGCDNFNSQETATQGIAVSGFASTPYNVSVGGTDFNQYHVWSTYWSDTNDPVTQLSAKSYIPEIPWNQNCAQLGVTICGGPNAPDGSVNIVAASGGPSTLYAKPSWQVGVTGMPNDNHRDQPDVSLLASAGFSGSAYVYCQGDYEGGTQPCVLLQNYYYNFPFIGGTSASAPAFAGIMALVNQYQASHGGNGRQGIANYTLYALAKKAGSSCASTAKPAASCVFYDVTNKGNIGLSGAIGTISVPCKGGTPNCSSSAASAIGVLVDPANKNVEAWTGGTGYDMATGLGTVNAYNLAVNWGTVSTIGTTTTLTLTPTTGITHGAENVTVSSTVTQASGTNKPTGTIALIATMADGSTLGLDTFTLSNGAVTSQKAQSLPGGTYKISAHYAGDGTNAPSDSTQVQVTVGKESSQTFIVIPTFDSAGNTISSNGASAPYLSSYIIRMYVGDKNAVLNPAGPPAATCDTTNILACPTGSVTLTANGQLMDGGTFHLNSAGYTRDISPTLTGGTYSLVANYQGDNSFTASSSVPTTFTITPGGSRISNLNVPGAAHAAVPVTLYASAVPTVYGGVPPTGTFTFYDGTNILSGTVSTNSSNGEIDGNIVTTFSTSGLHPITVKYSGDANYASSLTTYPSNIAISYATTTTQTLSATSINLGQSITITATATSTTKSPPMTGQFQFFTGYTPIPGPVSATLSTDGNGNQVLTSTTVTTAPESSEGITAAYLGDANFDRSNAAETSVSVNIPDFALQPANAAIVVSAGQSGTQQVVISPLGNMTSTVSLTCANPPHGTICSIEPAMVTLSGGHTATVTVTLSPSVGANAVHGSSFALKHAGLIPDSSHSMRWNYLALATVILLILCPGQRRRIRGALGLGFICMISIVIGCGGGSGGGSTNPPPPPPPTGPFATTTTVTTSNANVAAGTPVDFTATVTGSGKPTGYVVFALSNNFYVNANLANGTAVAHTADDIPGLYVLTAQYTGDTNNITSNSNAIPQTISGTSTIYINAHTSSLQHSTSMQANIQ